MILTETQRSTGMMLCGAGLFIVLIYLFQALSARNAVETKKDELKEAEKKTPSAETSTPEEKKKVEDAKKEVEDAEQQYEYYIGYIWMIVFAIIVLGGLFYYMYDMVHSYAEGMAEGMAEGVEFQSGPSVTPSGLPGPSATP